MRKKKMRTNCCHLARSCCYLIAAHEEQLGEARLGILQEFSQHLTERLRGTVFCVFLGITAGATVVGLPANFIPLYNFAIIVIRKPN